MQRILILLVLGLTTFSIQAQNRWFTRDGHIKFYSHTAVEDIEADNHQVNSIIDFETGDMAFSLLMKGFEFEKALMEEHFNEKYVESEKYPKAIFEGKLATDQVPNPDKAGTTTVTVTGKLTLHGVTRDVSATGSLTADGAGTVQAKATFYVDPDDYDIRIPGVVKEKIADSMEITVDVTLKPLPSK